LERTFVEVRRRRPPNSSPPDRHTGTAAQVPRRSGHPRLQAVASHWRTFSVKITSYGRPRRSSAVTFRPRARARSASHDQGCSSVDSSSSGSTTVKTSWRRLSRVLCSLLSPEPDSPDDRQPMVKPRSSCRIMRRPSSSATNSLTEKLRERGSGRCGLRSQMAPTPTMRPGLTEGRDRSRPSMASGCACQPPSIPLTSRLRSARNRLWRGLSQPRHHGHLRWRDQAFAPYTHQSVRL